MQSWRGAEAGIGLAFELSIMLLLDDWVVRRSSPISALMQKAMEIGERTNRHLARTGVHLGAGDRIEHPGRHHKHDAGFRLDLHEASGDPFLLAQERNTPAIQRMPAVMDDHFLPDMGTMTGRLLSAANPGSLLDRIGVPRGLRRSRR